MEEQLSAAGVVQHKVQLGGRLEAEAKRDDEGMLQSFQNAAFGDCMVDSFRFEELNLAQNLAKGDVSAK
jgi:hypothetical protein